MGKIMVGRLATNTVTDGSNSLQVPLTVLRRARVFIDAQISDSPYLSHLRLRSVLTRPQNSGHENHFTGLLARFLLAIHLHYLLKHSYHVDLTSAVTQCLHDCEGSVSGKQGNVTIPSIAKRWTELVEDLRLTLRAFPCICRTMC